MGDVENIDHKHLDKALKIFHEDQRNFWLASVTIINVSLGALYGNRDVSLQQLSATFRRGDLLDDIFKEISEKEGKR
jgi:hypothetical protein